MSESPQSQSTQAPFPEQTRGQEERSTGRAPAGTEVPPPDIAPRSGWIMFASMLMVLVGSFQVVIGLTALFHSDYYVVGPNGLVVNVDYTAWGWVHLLLGAVAVAAAFGLLAGQAWARVVGIGLAVLSAIVNVAFMQAYPWWSLTVVALDVLVIYAIAVHGEETKPA